MKKLVKVYVTIFIWSIVLAIMPIVTLAQPRYKETSFRVISDGLYKIAPMVDSDLGYFAQRHQDSVVLMVGNAIDYNPPGWRSIPPVIGNKFSNGPLIVYKMVTKQMLNPVAIGFNWNEVNRGNLEFSGLDERIFKVNLYDPVNQKVYFTSIGEDWVKDLWVAEVSKNLDTVFYKKVLNLDSIGIGSPEMRIGENNTVFAFRGPRVFLIDQVTDKVLKEIDIRNLGQPVNITGIHDLVFIDDKILISWGQDGGWLDACLAYLDTTGSASLEKIYSEIFKADGRSGIRITGVFHEYVYMYANSTQTQNWSVFRKSTTKEGLGSEAKWEYFGEVTSPKYSGLRENSFGVFWQSKGEDTEVLGVKRPFGCYILKEDGSLEPLNTEYCTDSLDVKYNSEDDGVFYNTRYNVFDVNGNLVLEDLLRENGAYSLKILRYQDSIFSFGDGCIGLYRTTDYPNSVKDYSLKEFGLYPNPTSGQVVFSSEIPQGAPIVVYNLQGQKVASFIHENNIIDLGLLSSGIYLLKVDGYKTHKVIKL